MILPKSIAERYDIPINDVVELLSAGKAFVLHFESDESAFDMHKLKALNLRPAQDLFLVVEMKLINPDGSRRGGLGRFVIPLKDS